MVYLINLYAVTNASDIEDGEEKLTDDVIETMPGILGNGLIKGNLIKIMFYKKITKTKKLRHFSS